jgi:ureidoacrylate peracid hydrolase
LANQCSLAVSGIRAQRRATELDPVLRNLGTRRLIVAGLQTNVCVETTARSAMMRNFEVAVPQDAVSTDGTALHAAALDAMRALHRGRALARR